ncbi:MAG: aminotransferase class V-fold PLP-dependent enzyme [bacterium]|nr:aminotransferase class V-fold PLP-dependent enzyme [bacterium]MDE0239505.1 aminotransferase class V-fold PLP-dependent enzyme [bacterium]
MIDVARARADTPAVKKLAFFYSCGAGLMPRPVLDALHGHLDLEARIGGYAAEDEAEPAVQATYASIARLLNCLEEEVALVENATVAWRQAFYGLAQDMKPGDNIVTAIPEYASNFIAFLQTAKRRGVEIVVAPNDGMGQVDVAALDGLVDGRTKLIAMTHVPTSGGLVTPAAEVGRIARGRGVPYLLDACQSAGQLPLDVEAIGCDFLSATGRKFLRGPRGTGFLYARKTAMAACEPPMLDLLSATWVAADRYELHPGARRYENWEGFVAGKGALGVAVDYALALGLDAIAERNRDLATDLRERLAAIPGVIVRDAGGNRCAIVTFTHDRFAPDDLVARLALRNIVIGSSQPSSTLLDFESRKLPPLCRAAVHYLNTGEEVARLADAVAEL